ncbi:VOC family protein [Streptomyces sp. NBC_00557]|uniref:VOC family protein n=1 Tax=Streptomyces sp. NBC_00557 TaxID=2975776 RepID=UPI002E80D1FB|nr:VOC family protein [Streptomyces sp. NBC_00557]WUC40216.1 VOC family protein [Streptomyces sp. NBC_00557]
MSPRPPILVGTLHPRLLVDDFAACFRFYDAVLDGLCGAKVAEGNAQGPYARWNADDEPVLAVIDRAAMKTMLEVREGDADTALLCFRLDDVPAAQRLCEEYGGSVVSAAAPRPEWGPETVVAYVRDPAGHLIELQASPD